MFDMSADEMLRAISAFSKSSGHSSLAALAIMSHGDTLGNICGHDGTSVCSVQEVIDALCQPELQSTIKVQYQSYLLL